MQMLPRLPVIETHSFSEVCPIFGCPDIGGIPDSPGEYDFSGQLPRIAAEIRNSLSPYRDQREFLLSRTRFQYQEDGICEVITEHYLGI